MDLNSFLARGSMNNEQFLTLLLLTLVYQCGELHLDAASLVAVDPNAKLLTDWDLPRQQLIIRSQSAGTRIFEASGIWQRTVSPASAPSSASQASSTHSILTPEKMVEAQNERVRRDLERQWKEQTGAVLNDLAPPVRST